MSGLPVEGMQLYPIATSWNEKWHWSIRWLLPFRNL